MPLGHSKSLRASSPNRFINASMPNLKRLLPRIAGSFVRRPLESCSGTASVLTNTPTCGITKPPTVKSASK